MAKHSNYNTSLREEVGSGLGALTGVGLNAQGSSARVLGAGVVGGLVGRSLATKEKDLASRARKGLATSGAVLGGVHGVITGRSPVSSIVRGIGQAYIGGLAGDGLGVHVDRLNKMASDKRNTDVGQHVAAAAGTATGLHTSISKAKNLNIGPSAKSLIGYGVAGNLAGVGLLEKARQIRDKKEASPLQKGLSTVAGFAGGMYGVTRGKSVAGVIGKGLAYGAVGDAAGTGLATHMDKVNR